MRSFSSTARSSFSSLLDICRRCYCHSDSGVAACGIEGCLSSEDQHQPGLRVLLHLRSYSPKLLESNPDIPVVFYFYIVLAGYADTWSLASLLGICWIELRRDEAQGAFFVWFKAGSLSPQPRQPSRSFFCRPQPRAPSLSSPSFGSLPVSKFLLLQLTLNFGSDCVP